MTKAFFSISDVTLYEGEERNITITRSGNISIGTSVRMVSRDGTAINHISYVPQDYGSVNLNFSFAPGETIRTHPVNALEDTFTIDNNISIIQATELVWSFRNLEFDSVVRLTVPTYNYTTENKAQVLILEDNFYNFLKSNDLLK